jgi:hypothetical protein
MILITKIETLTTDKDFAEVIKMSHDSFNEYIPFKERVEKAEVIREIIHGRRFVDPQRNLDVVIGITDEAGEMLGLTHDAFENLEGEREQYRLERDVIKCELESIKAFGFFKRLKCLFTGIK